MISDSVDSPIPNLRESSNIVIFLGNSKKLTAVREKFSEKYPKILFEPYSMHGVFKGFSIIEADDPDRLTRLRLHYMPEMKYKFVPIFEVRKVVEHYLKTKE